MNGMRKWLGLLLGLAFAAFALPGVADNAKKQYSLTMSSPVVQTPPPYTVQATIKNDIPTGNSSISSFKLSYSGGLTIVGVQQPGNGTASFTANSVTVKFMTSPLFPGQSLTVTIGVSSCNSDSPGAWSASVWNGQQLNGQSFNLVAPDSTLATAVSCGSVAPGGEIQALDSVNPQKCFTGQRGFYDQDGGVRASVQYFVTNNLFSGNPQVHFKWPDDNTGDPFAAFEYDVCAAGSDTPAIPTVQVAWLNTLGGSASTGSPAFVPAQACNAYANFLPAPYGTLVNDLLPASEGDVSIITVNPLITLDPSGAQGGPFAPLQPNGTIKHPVIGTGTGQVPYFDVVIGNERLTVTHVDSDDGAAGDLSDEVAPEQAGEVELETWTVTRGVGHTPTLGQSANSLVMSTPKPLLPAAIACTDSSGNPLPAGQCKYTPGGPALMCVAKQQANDPAAGSHTTTFIDVGGDGWGNHP